MHPLVVLFRFQCVNVVHYLLETNVKLGWKETRMLMKISASCNGFLCKRTLTKCSSTLSDHLFKRSPVIKDHHLGGYIQPPGDGLELQVTLFAL